MNAIDGVYKTYGEAMVGMLRRTTTTPTTTRKKEIKKERKKLLMHSPLVDVYKITRTIETLMGSVDKTL